LKKLSNIKEIKNPEFLKDLSIAELESLATNIRHFLINSISETGGHLASNLGIVELTIAIHRVFDSPKDKIIFDVGHQIYTHKILTGRAKQFDNLRQFGGISGFPKRDESEHDIFETGHASTSVSAAIGIIEALRQFGDSSEVISIIGDGAMTGGLALEAINSFGHNKEKMIIVLNDNEMSISKNVGALSRLFKEIRVNRQYQRSKKMVPNFIKKLINRFTSTVKYFVEGANYFEALGYKYYGPIDGHNFKDLIKHFELAKKSQSSVLLHVKTEKGKGYEPAIKNKVKWHGVGNYEVDTGVIPTNGNKSWSKFIAEEVDKIDNVTIITPAMISGSGLESVHNKIIDVGIAEGHAATMAAGIASQKGKVFLPMYSTFMQRAYDNILHDIDKQKLKVVLGVDRAGIVPHDGNTHQGVFDISMLNSMPNMTICMPSNAKEARGLVSYAFNKCDGPIAIRYPKGELSNTEGILKIDNPIWRRIRKGTKMNIISYGPDLSRLDGLLQRNDIDANLYNAIFIKPFDVKILDQIIDSGLPLLIYETVISSGSLGQSILSYISDKKACIKVFHMNLISTPDHGSVPDLLKQHKLDDAAIISKIEEILSETG